MRRLSPGSDRGSISLLVVVVVALAVVGATAVSRLTVELTDRTRADLAADAAALAGVSGGRAAAAEAAQRNGAELVAFTTVGGDVVVEVRLGAARATARAGP